MCEIRKLRTVDDCIKWFKEQDPDSRITKDMIREIALTGLVPCVWRGKKVLIDLEALPDAISAWIDQSQSVDRHPTDLEKSEPDSRYGKVRAI